MTAIGRTAALLALTAGLCACEGYEPPPLPVSPANPSASTVPARVVLTASSRPDYQLDVAANVLSPDGHGVPNVAVQFGIGAGTVAPQVTLTDQRGVAQVIAVSTTFTSITATIAGGIGTSIVVLQSRP